MAEDPRQLTRGAGTFAGQWLEVPNDATEAGFALELEGASHAAYNVQLVDNVVGDGTLRITSPVNNQEFTEGGIVKVEYTAPETMDGAPLRYRVSTPWDFREGWKLRSFDVWPDPAGQPLVRWRADVTERPTSSRRAIEGHVEIRWSHGRFSGAPEAKVHPGIYRRRNGQLDLSTITGPGFGYRVGEIQRDIGPAKMFTRR